MPYIVVKDVNACSASKPWAVKNQQTGDVRGRCHATREKATAQQRALYVAMRKEGKLAEYFLAPVAKLFADMTANDSVRWVQAFPYDSWDHPIYGTTTVTPEIANEYVKNFRRNVRGQDLPIGYNHGEDRAKGEKAAGWIRDMEARNDGLYVKVEFTPPAVEELKNGEWRYYSSESWDEWTHPHTGEKYQYVISGGTLTNKPYVKGMLPINFSEVMTEDELEEVEKDFAVKTPKKPYGSVTYADPGYQSDGVKRYPLDTETHIRAAWSYINMPRNASKYSSSQLASIKGRIRSAMKRIGAQLKSMSETLTEEDQRIEELLNDNLIPEDELYQMSEVKEWEHSEPGISSPPPPRLDEESGIDEPDRTGGWRRSSPPDQDAPTPVTSSYVVPVTTTSAGTTANVTWTDTSKGGKVSELTEKDVRELRAMLEIDEDGDILEATKLKFGELSALRNAVSAADQERIFAEQYPQFWQEHNKLMERDRDNQAKNFSETVSKIRKAEGYGLKETRQGLSVKALETIREVHKKFAEGTATVTDFEDCIKTITNGGILEFGEIGTNSGEDELPSYDTSSAVGVANSRKMFAEVVSKIQNEKGIEFNEALQEAAKKYPDLADAYKVTLPA